ncbi:MAG: rhodanese-related sulfurtransferase [Pseudomonadota bacterium]
MSTCHVVAFYEFTRVGSPRVLGEAMRARATELDLLGTVIVAPEGLNATLAGDHEQLHAALDWLANQPGFSRPVGRWSVSDSPPFRRLRIKYRKEIVSIGRDDINPADGQGRHVDAAQWNRLLDDPNTLVIDTRNDYEIEVGTFPGAVDPKTTNFREFLGFVERELAEDRERPIAMFCTGGIRCEKATAVMQDLGFSNLFQLNGGIIKYLDEVEAQPELDNRWHGECFVFDERVAVDAKRAPGGFVQCHGCRRALGPEDLAHPDYEPGICCAKCVGQLTDQQRRQFSERKKQVALAEARGEQHIGKRF